MISLSLSISHYCHLLLQFSIQTCTHEQINEENTFVFTFIPPLPLLQTKPVVTMATDGKEAKLDERVEVTVSEGPGKRKQSEDLCKRPALKVTVQHTKCYKDFLHCLFKNCLAFHGLQKTSRIVCCVCVSLKEYFTQNDNSVNIYASSCL